MYIYVCIWKDHSKQVDHLKIYLVILMSTRKENKLQKSLLVLHYTLCLNSSARDAVESSAWQARQINQLWFWDFRMSAVS